MISDGKKMFSWYRRVVEHCPKRDSLIFPGFPGQKESFSRILLAAYRFRTHRNKKISVYDVII